jgi:proteasome lid subunit RPN8/RPN11
MTGTWRSPVLQLPKAFADEIIAHAREEEPDECCGLLAGKNGSCEKLYRITNSEHSPKRYFMEPQELYHAYRDIEDGGWELLAIYHSHPRSQAYPSATDVKLATWPEATYIIVSLSDREQPVMRAFHIVDDHISEVEMEVVD